MFETLEKPIQEMSTTYDNTIYCIDNIIVSQNLVYTSVTNSKRTQQQLPFSSICLFAIFCRSDSNRI